VGKKTIHHMDFETLVEVNGQVVALSGEPQGYTPADRKKLTALVTDVEHRADNQYFEEAVAEKAALLVFKLASGQYFRAGNKRTALVAGLAFLAKNGYSVDIEKHGLVSVVDKAGIGAANLDDLYTFIRRMLTKSKPNRKGWEGVIRGAVEANKDFLIRLSSDAEDSQ
jgi:prophage maintenance system killer protein